MKDLTDTELNVIQNALDSYARLLRTLFYPPVGTLDVVHGLINKIVDEKMRRWLES